MLKNKIYFKFRNFLGKIVTSFVMFLIFVLTIIPIGFIIRLFNKDLLKLKIDKSAKSYWIKRKKPIGSMKNQY